MRNVLMAIGALALLVLASGCGSSSSNGSCTEHVDCPQAFVCVDGSCAQVECAGLGDCPEGEVICAGAGVDSTKPETRFCSPIICKNTDECPEGYECSEFKQCVLVDETPADTTQGLDNTPMDDVNMKDGPSVPEGVACSVCTTDTTCGGLTCHALGTGTFCFDSCTTHDDCDNGWICASLGMDGTFCVPRKYSCDIDCLATGCPDGQVCDQETGLCAQPVGQCGQCDFDEECGDGFRCFIDEHYCAPVCIDEVCPNNSTCNDVNLFDNTASLCVSQTAGCCYGDNCENACPPATPYVVNGSCVECRTSNDCLEGETCGVDNSCQSDQCSNDPTHPYLYNGQCVQCITNDHCTGGKTCQVNVCNTGEQPAECSYCQAPYSACTQINGVWSCVQCTDDSFCPGEGNSCDLTLFACKNAGNPQQNCTGCTNNTECVSSSGQYELACEVSSGCCYDVGGGCDGVEAFCAGGAECVGLLDMLMGGGGGMGMELPADMGLGACSCSSPISDLTQLLTCMLPGACPSECVSGSVCADLGALLGASSGSGVCINLSSLLGGLGL